MTNTSIETISDKTLITDGAASLAARLASEEINPDHILDLQITSKSINYLFSNLGFSDDQIQKLNHLLTVWEPGLERDAFEGTLMNLPGEEELSARQEIDAPLPITSEIQALGQAIFWAYMCKYFDPVFPEKMLGASSAPSEVYSSIEQDLKRFVIGVLFAPDSPLLLILQQEYAETNKPLQTEFLKGVIKPFVDCYDEEYKKSFWGRFKHYLSQHFSEVAEGIKDLNLSPEEVNVLNVSLRKNLSIEATPDLSQVKLTGDIARDCQRMNILIDSYDSEPSKELMIAIEKELINGTQLDEATTTRILQLTTRRVDADSKNKSLRDKVCKAMHDRDIGHHKATAYDPFQHTIALVTLMSLQQANPGFVDRIEPLLSQSIDTANSERHPNFRFRQTYLADLRRLMATILIEKEKELL